jgi:Domain of unknown function (DUF4190)
MTDPYQPGRQGPAAPPPDPARSFEPPTYQQPSTPRPASAEPTHQQPTYQRQTDQQQGYQQQGYPHQQQGYQQPIYPAVPGAPLPYQQPSGYPAAPAHSYGYPAPRPTEGLAIASLVVSCVGVLGLCLYGMGGILGVAGAVLGHIAHGRIRRLETRGAGMALAGIIVGWIAAALALVGIALLALVIRQGYFSTR